MIALCLQCSPHDTDAAMDLAKLICELTKEKRNDGEFFLVYRKDCDIRLAKFFEHLAGMRFGRAKACQARNHDVGWPGGSNMLAVSAMMEMSILHHQGFCTSPAFLLFEPDCIPLTFDWLDRLSAEWDLTASQGKEAYGHWNMPGSIPENLHMNGNCVLRSDFFDRHGPLVGSAMQGWDFFYREKLIAVSRDSNLIEQYYQCPTITLEQLTQVSKNEVRPAILHGVKDSSGRQNIRKLLFQVPA
jgi:hypothetical protein